MCGAYSSMLACLPAQPGTYLLPGQVGSVVSLNIRVRRESVTFAAKESRGLIQPRRLTTHYSAFQAIKSSVPEVLSSGDDRGLKFWRRNLTHTPQHNRIPKMLKEGSKAKKSFIESFIYSKQQHRQKRHKHKGSDAESRCWLTLDQRLLSNDNLISYW